VCIGYGHMCSTGLDFGSVTELLGWIWKAWSDFYCIDRLDHYILGHGKGR
jgi:hypothetical protein